MSLFHPLCSTWGLKSLSIAIYPDFTLVIARIMGVVDNFNAVVLMGFLMVFLMLFKLLSAIEKIEQNVSEITRKEALHTAHERIEEMRKKIKAQQGRNALCTSQQQNISPRKQDD